MNADPNLDPSLSLDDPLLRQAGLEEPSGFIHEGETFQHYQVLRRPDGTLWELGRGAMGVTYKAFDTNLRCYVALKVISGQHLHSEMAGQRFIREARVAARLRHPNIASVYHLGVDPQGFFYSMEFIDGETLEDLVERVGPLPLETVLRIALQTARALAAASRQGLIHRDIKPANLMILHQDEDGEDRLLVKVIDFGLARTYDPGDSSPQLTATGFVGTPLYASPEQLEEKTLDVRSDIYSLGVTLWILLTGRPPFEGKMTQVITHHLHSEPPWHNLGHCPEPARALLERMLCKDPADRFQTAGELRVAVEGCLRGMAGTSDLFTGDTDAGSPINPASAGLARSEASQTAAGTQTFAGSLPRRPLPPTGTARPPAMAQPGVGTGLRSRLASVRQVVRRKSVPVWSSVAGAAAVLCAASFLFGHRSLDSADAVRPAPAARSGAAPVAAPAAAPTAPAPGQTPPPTAVARLATEPGPVTAPPSATPPVQAEAPSAQAADSTTPRDEPWGALVDGNPSPTMSAPTPETPTTAGENPASAAVTPTQTAQAVPTATTDEDDDAADNDKSTPAKGRARTTSRSPRVHHAPKRAPTPAPNLFQKIFGIKPKPKPR